MMNVLLLLMVIGVVSPQTETGGRQHVTVALVLHSYECKLRVDGRITTTQVKASDAGQAKKLAQQQFPNATVLSVKKVD